MALTTASSPSSSPEPKKAESKSAPAPVSAPGATDPAVLQLLAEQQTAVSNGDADAIREINKKLGDLGYH